ncbi:hypothetical protein TWF106_001050 [Orbilia oligospora]|uniref:Alpha/beta hydrolase fold-3 domain-containing protein n=1 Tax=Orbilia oligospora TaxID=2813651 RepID=A0A6G1LWN3_ORBOL|nr:hypothetical protein TWF788_002333 [Orbilia oligospora]KAF3198709.1 hypothetical protein TWF679_001800 [Orbilia oligospora]KAF3205728.1 hypothetical protein TWF106_001050 [Orbilia oligospora]KAF3234599.1 hypothetical protein TWF192_001272 [Orbilia oligospora]
MPPPKRPSWFLQAQKTSLQAAMSFGMYLGSWAGPWPPEPSFFVEIPATISPTKGTFNLIFYVPKSYSQRTQSSRFPVLVNFHGGGMSIGSGTDDARWAKDVMQQLGAVVVSVEYRLAPEHTFPTAVQDSVDAILYLVDNAEELYLDRDRIILSGFSSGGNLAFTAPILLEQLRRHQMLASEPGFEDQATDEFDVPASKLPEGYPLPDFTIKAIIAWYPSVDFTQTRHERRNTNPHPEVSMPGAMSNMFDTAYIFNSHLNAYESAHPLLSPGTAPTELLDAALPSRVVIYTCQFDALQKEGELFATRIREELGREVKFQMVEGVAHAWDKMPNPIWPPSRIEDVYKDACDSMKDYL